MLNCCVKAKISGQSPFKGDWSHWAAALPATALYRPWHVQVSDVLLHPWRPAQGCQRAAACLLLLSTFPSWWVGVKAPWNIWCMQMNKQVNDQKLSVQEEKKKSIVLSFLETCYGQISSSSSQVCSIKYITQSTRIYKAYCKSNLPRQVVFNYPYHFQERNILNI